MTFCPKVNYAVPYNPTNFTGPNLTTWYDTQAQNQFQYFNYSLQQVACDTVSDAQYSLAVTCDDCTAAYRDWLCAVMAPRCEDFTSTKSYLQPRAISQPFPQNSSMGSPSQDPLFGPPYTLQTAFNSSRNPLIDQNIVPGPYKELLPCGDLCYRLVQTCPAVLGFACPYDSQGYNRSYGYPVMDGMQPQCNFPGKVFGVSPAATLRPSKILLGGGLVVVMGLGMGMGMG